MVSQGLTSGLQTQIVNCLFNMSIWICNRRLKIHPPKLNSPCVSMPIFFLNHLKCSSKSQIFPVTQDLVVKLNYVLSLKLPFKSISQPVRQAQ